MYANVSTYLHKGVQFSKNYCDSFYQQRIVSEPFYTKKLLVISLLVSELN